MYRRPVDDDAGEYWIRAEYRASVAKYTPRPNMVAEGGGGSCWMWTGSGTFKASTEVKILDTIAYYSQQESHFEMATFLLLLLSDLLYKFQITILVTFIPLLPYLVAYHFNHNILPLLPQWLTILVKITYHSCHSNLPFLHYNSNLPFVPQQLTILPTVTYRFWHSNLPFLPQQFPILTLQQ